MDKDIGKAVANRECNSKGWFPVFAADPSWWIWRKAMLVVSKPCSYHDWNPFPLNLLFSDYLRLKIALHNNDFWKNSYLLGYIKREASSSRTRVGCNTAESKCHSGCHTFQHSQSTLSAWKPPKEQRPKKLQWQWVFIHSQNVFLTNQEKIEIALSSSSSSYNSNKVHGFVHLWFPGWRAWWIHKNTSRNRQRLWYSNTKKTCPFADIPRIGWPYTKRLWIHIANSCLEQSPQKFEQTITPLASKRKHPPLASRGHAQPVHK